MSETQLSINSDVSGLRPQNMDELFKLAGMIAGSALAPKDYRGKPNDTSIAMMMGLELGLNPMQAIQNIAVINGRPSIWGDAMLALVQNHPSFKSIEESINESTMTATCTVCRKGGKPHTETFSRQDAETAGLWGRNTWKQYPKRMLSMRARGFALRNQFADALLGLISREEAYDFKEEVEINPVATERPDLKEIEYYSDEEFDKKFQGWIDFMQKKKRGCDGLIATVQSKGKLFTEEQKQALKNNEYQGDSA